MRKTQFSIRLHPGLLEVVEKQAKSERRNRNQMIELMLENITGFNPDHYGETPEERDDRLQEKMFEKD